MDCPICKQVSSGSTHCFYCGWQEPLIIKDESKEKPAEEPNAQMEQKQPPPAPQERSNDKQAGIKPEDNLPSPQQRAQPNAGSKPEDSRKKELAVVEPVKPSEDMKQVQPRAERLAQSEDKRSDEPQSPSESEESIKERPDQADDHNEKSSGNEEVKARAAQNKDKMKEDDEKVLPSSGKKTKIKDSELEQFNAVKGHKNIFIAKLNNFQGREPFDRSYEEKTFIEYTTELPNKDASSPDFVPEEIEEKSAILNQESLMLISCVDHNIAMGAAYVLIEKLGISDNGRRRLLNIEKLGEEGSSLSIYIEEKDRCK